VALRRFELFGVVDEEQRVVRDAFGFFAELHFLQLVCMFVTFAIVTTKTKQLITVGKTINQDDGEIERVQSALAQHQTKFAPLSAGYFQFSFLMRAFGFRLNTLLVISRKRLWIAEKSLFPRQ
jgi:hypothetical protein